MSELEQQPTGGISRRTVTKAMAWSIPAIAIAAPAPAFAASGGVFSLGGTGCKLPGSSSTIYKGYVFALSAVNNSNATVTVNVVSATLNGAPLGSVAIVNLDTKVGQVNPFTLAPNTSYPRLALLTQLAPNSQQGTLTIVYTVDGGSQQTITASVPSVAPIQGSSCTSFTADQKLTIENATFGG